MNRLQSLPLNLRDNMALYIILVAVFITLPVVAALTEKSVEIPNPELPVEFPNGFIHYATVQRPDGTIRDLYMNESAFSKFDGLYSLPEGTTLVITGYVAQKDQAGNWVMNEGQYTRGQAFDMIHIRTKRRGWPDESFPSDARNGDWNYGSFQTGGVRFEEPLTPCFHCHNTAEQPDFTYTFPLLMEYWRTGEVVYSFCGQTGRTPC